MNSTQRLLTCSMARVQAQFLPTQRSPSGRGPACTSWTSAALWPCSASVRSTRSAVASLESSSTTSTCQLLQGISLFNTPDRQSAMLAASL